MTESKEKLDRLRAKRGGHRGVCTKLTKEADELLHFLSDTAWRVLKGVNGNWDLPIFWMGKWDFMHWDCDSSTKKQ